MAKEKDTVEIVETSPAIVEASTVAEEIVERSYTLRRLKDKDLFPILGIISRVFPDDLAKVFVQVASKEKSLQEIGFVVASKLVISIVRNLSNEDLADDVYAFLSDVSGIPAEEIGEMEFGTTPMMIWDIINNEKNAGFFKVLSKLS